MASDRKRRVAVAVVAAGLAATGVHARTARAMAACWVDWGTKINAVAVKYHVSQATILAVMYHESGCNPRAVRLEPHLYHSPEIIRRARGDEAERRFLASSWGVMQVLGATARGMGYTLRPEEFADYSLEYGTRYLALKLRQWGSLQDALAAYNGGDGAVLRKRRTGTYGPRVELYVRTVLVLRSQYALALTSRGLAGWTPGIVAGLPPGTP
jgi:soluble lytic murein transglycosylase-like protein